jgi:hypothetical protein
LQAEYQSVDEDDELDQYVDQIESETQGRGTVGSEQPIQMYLDGAYRLPGEQPEASVGDANGWVAVFDISCHWNSL